MSTAPRPLGVVPLTGIGAVLTGDDLAALLVSAAERAGHRLVDDDVLVVSSKVVAKALGLWRDDRETAVLEESAGVVAERTTPNGTTRIVRAAAGPVMAAAGVDASNAGPEGGGRVLVLPRDPDAAAARLRREVAARCGTRPAVVLSDTSGRPWRVGQTDFALGAAGLQPVDDLRGGTDADGGALSVTVRAVADEVAAAAELVKGKADGVPAVVVHGLGHHVTADDGPGAAGLVRFGPGDWFATGTVESVRAALGCPPGTAGVPLAPAAPDPSDVVGVLARAAAVARTGARADGLLGAVALAAGPGPEEVTVTAAGTAGGTSVEDVVRAARVAERVVVAARAEGLRCGVEADGALLRVRPVPAGATPPSQELPA
ncbi:coenzyme F420-0:L-glutamate ligase [Aquipuribacter nitratireducens]|uniref:Coenzyme F420-0:L-glutamate ligase n=1 Tax=Aquipuribacter nitratireducens TaxID=650104 RepID=A0ABW0GK27_9MICO